MGAFMGAGSASADVDATATLSPDVPANETIDIPTILSKQDSERYQRIFEVQEGGDWKAADRLIAKLDSRLLMGHVLAQRYLHPTKYRSRYKELKGWMDAYADHPQARQLYKLALRRRPKNWKAPTPPKRFAVSAFVTARTVAAVPKKKGKRLTSSQRRQVRVWKRQIRGQLRNGWSKAVKRLLQTKDVQKLFSEVEYDQARARLAARYLTDGRDDWALEWAGAAAARSGPYVPEANWTAGLAAWRLRRFPAAAHHFEAVAKAPVSSAWLVSAGAFWAARSNLVGREPEKVNGLLALAAEHPRTFYGLLARRLLGISTSFRWEMPVLTEAALGELKRAPTGRRALALLQVGMNRRAERELRNLAGAAGDDLAKGILALATRAAMPSLAVRLDERMHPNGGGYDGASYPLPDWQLKGGYNVDRALVYAMIRQESRFNPRAKSRAGARGLMQLMPGTASFVAGDRRFRWSKRPTLFKPEVNLTLGQKYIHMLLGNAKINGDMFFMAAAWNGGPGNLKKWRRKVDHMDDALFFIETIPSRETRIFIERVFTNLWIYRDRLDQQAPSLDAIAAGKWPLYIAQDQKSTQVAENGENRRRTGIPAR